jgi:hypothetical protein
VGWGGVGWGGVAAGERLMAFSLPSRAVAHANLNLPCIAQESSVCPLAPRRRCTSLQQHSTTQPQCRTAATATLLQQPVQKPASCAAGRSPDDVLPALLGCRRQQKKPHTRFCCINFAPVRMPEANGLHVVRPSPYLSYSGAYSSCSRHRKHIRHGGHRVSPTTVLRRVEQDPR